MESKPYKVLSFKNIVLITVTVIIVSCVLWFVVLPFILRYEKLVISPYSSYYWVANSKAEINQVVLVFLNNGTQESTIKDIWIDGASVNSADWRSYYGSTMQPTESTTVYVAPNNLTFERDQDYNLTIVTARNNRFTFLLEVSEGLIRTENVTIAKCDFYHWPPPWFSDPRIGLDIINKGRTDVIIKEVRVNGTAYSILDNPWICRSEADTYLRVSAPWESGKTYNIEIETIIGNTYNFVATAEEG